MILNWKIKSFYDLNSLELYKILQLRINVFMLEQECLYPECDDKDLKAKHLFAFNEHDVIAYARLLPPFVSYDDASIGRVIVNPKYRKHKVGYKLMQKAIEVLTEEFENSDIRISAQAHLSDFYKNLLFQPVGQEYLEDGIPHIEMVLKKENRGL